jgi:hypothetical protein
MAKYLSSPRKWGWRFIPFLLAAMAFAGYSLCAHAGDAQTDEYMRSLSFVRHYLVKQDGSVDVTTIFTKKLIKALPQELMTEVTRVRKEGWVEFEPRLSISNSEVSFALSFMLRT